MSVKGVVFNVVRGSMHDGPGVRDVVYLKGCSLACVWCHNPEGQKSTKQLCWAEKNCMGCGSCTEACPHGNITVQEGTLQIRYDACTGCGRCCQECPTGALSLYGRMEEPEQLLRQFLRDRDFFSSDGGVTFSGGECLLQEEFMASMLTLCRREGLHTLLETALHVPEETVRRLAPMADEIYADLKHMDSAAHRRMTGAGNEQILRNLQVLSGLNVPVTVRTPLIPGFNDGRENLTASARLAHDTGAQAYVLLPYNPMAGSKYPMLGRTFGFPPYEAQEKKEVEALCSRLNRECGWDGFVRTQK